MRKNKIPFYDIRHVKITKTIEIEKLIH